VLVLAEQRIVIHTKLYTAAVSNCSTARGP
jgi:hypothetical protein